MIQTKEELFLAELGINTKEEVELAYGAKIKITDLLKKYEGKQLLIPVVTESFKIEVHNNSGAWYEIVLANSYLEAKMKVEKAYPNNTHVSLEYEYDKPIF